MGKVGKAGEPRGGCLSPRQMAAAAEKAAKYEANVGFKFALYLRYPRSLLLREVFSGVFWGVSGLLVSSRQLQSLTATARNLHSNRAVYLGNPVSDRFPAGTLLCRG